MHRLHLHLPILACLLALTASAHAQTIARPVELPANFTGGPVFIQLRTAGHLDPRAQGLGVFLDDQPTDFRLLQHDPEALTSLAVDLPSGARDVQVRYGPDPIAENADRRADVPLSLMMRTFPLNRSAFRSVDDLQRAIADANPFGVATIDRIHFAHNPFGPDQRFVTEIEGLLRLGDRTTLRLFSNHDAAAFVLIDDEPIITSPQPFLERGFDTLQQAAVEVTLDAGTHALRYLHVAADNPPRLALGTVEQRRAIALPSRHFIHHPRATLGPARFHDVETDQPLLGFDAELLDRIGHDDHLYLRYALRPLAPPPDGLRYRWRFGDQTGAQRTDAERFEHVFVSPGDAAADEQQWPVTLELIDADDETVAQVDSRLRPAIFGHSETAGDADLLHRYADAIAEADYDRASADLLAAYHALLLETDQPALIAPIAEPFVARFGDRRGEGIRQIKRTLAIHLAADEPERAAELFGEVARTEPDSWQAVTAAAEQLDLMIFRLGQTDIDAVHRIVARLYRNRAPHERALLEARLGDAHRVAGRFEEARAAYEKAQRTRDPNIDPRRAAVQKRAYRETALSYLQQERYPALRDKLLEWEANFPTAKLEGDLLLLTGRYFEAVGEQRRAAIEYRTLLEMKPMHPRRPELAYRLGECLWQLGETDEARKWLEEVAEEYPNSPFAAQAKARLQ